MLCGQSWAPPPYQQPPPWSSICPTASHPKLFHMLHWLTLPAEPHPRVLLPFLKVTVKAWLEAGLICEVWETYWNYQDLEHSRSSHWAFTALSSSYTWTSQGLASQFYLPHRKHCNLGLVPQAQGEDSGRYGSSKVPWPSEDWAGRGALGKLPALETTPGGKRGHQHRARTWVTRSNGEVSTGRTPSMQVIYYWRLPIITNLHNPKLIFS